MTRTLHNCLLNLKENKKLLFNRKETLNLKSTEILPWLGFLEKTCEMLHSLSNNCLQSMYFCPTLLFVCIEIWTWPNLKTSLAFRQQSSLIVLWARHCSRYWFFVSAWNRHTFLHSGGLHPNKVIVRGESGGSDRVPDNEQPREKLRLQRVGKWQETR